MAMPRPRNPHADTVSANITAAIYDEFQQRLGKRTTQMALTDLIRTFNSLPPDAREIMLSRMTNANKIRVLQAVIRQLQKP
jgi:Mg/Co/Ni transporter MgtE